MGPPDLLYQWVFQQWRTRRAPFSHSFPSCRAPSPTQTLSSQIWWLMGTMVERDIFLVFQTNLGQSVSVPPGLWRWHSVMGHGRACHLLGYSSSELCKHLKSLKKISGCILTESSPIETPTTSPGIWTPMPHTSVQKRTPPTLNWKVEVMCYAIHFAIILEHLSLKLRIVSSFPAVELMPEILKTSTDIPACESLRFNHLTSISRSPAVQEADCRS